MVWASPKIVEIFSKIVLRFSKISPLQFLLFCICACVLEGFLMVSVF